MFRIFRHTPPHVVLGRLVVVWWRCAFWRASWLGLRLGRLEIYWWRPS